MNTTGICSITPMNEKYQRLGQSRVPPFRTLLGTVALTLCATICFAFGNQSGNTGNTKFSEPGVAVMPLDAASEAAERAEDIQYMRDHPDVFPSALVDEIEAATDPATGSIRIVRGYNPSPGVSDSGTIGINGGMPAWLRAIVLAHEYEHAKRAQTPGSGPDAKDPETNATPCGDCKHAQMRVADADRIAALTCSEEHPILPEQRKEMCEAVDTSRCATSELLTKCYYAGCPSCCGFSYIPNAGELLTSQPCCD